MGQSPVKSLSFELIGQQLFVTLNDGLAAYIPRDDTAVSTLFLTTLGQPCFLRNRSIHDWIPQILWRRSCLRASALPSKSASIFRAREAGTRAFKMRFSRPGTILGRFLIRPLGASDTHCSTPGGFSRTGL